MVIRISAILFAVAFAGGAARARSDVFELKEGGQIVGQRVEGTEGGDYVVKTAEGAQVTLAREQVQRVVLQNDALLEYERRSRRAPDTADAHRELAQWCRENQLSDEADVHLQRVVDLDPTDEDARRSLGLQRVGNRWLNRDEVMTLRGLVFFDGKYRTPQDVAIRQRDQSAGDDEAQWHVKLRLWRGWLNSSRQDRIDDGRAQIAAVRDPRAAPALIKLLDGEEDDWTFEFLLGVLGQLDDARAIQTLEKYSLQDDDAEVRAQCIDDLMRGMRPVSILPYVQALKSKDNIIVNRAGEALGMIGDAAAISPLIDALVTPHKYQISPGSNPGQISADFGGSGGGGLSMGGKGPTIVKKDETNQGVLRALMKLSGKQNFDYDEQAWRNWYVDLQMRQHANSRRDQ
jgi:hypothetical protein